MLGVDLRDPISAELAAQLEDVWHRGQVILLRDQTLSEEEQVRFAECFGTLAKTLNVHATGKHPAIMLISNIREDGKPIGALPDGEMHFHTDQCYVERPAKASMLYAIEMPSVGGNTLFANAYMAYETLPAEVKRRIDGKRRSTPTTTTTPRSSAAPGSATACRIIRIRWCAPIRRPAARRSTSTG